MVSASASPSDPDVIVSQSMLMDILFPPRFLPKTLHTSLKFLPEGGKDPYDSSKRGLLLISTQGSENSGSDRICLTERVRDPHIVDHLSISVASPPGLLPLSVGCEKLKLERLERRSSFCCKLIRSSGHRETPDSTRCFYGSTAHWLTGSLSLVICGCER